MIFHIFTATFQIMHTILNIIFRKPATTLEQVQAAIKVNQVSLLSVGIDTATTNGFCDVNRRWTMGTTPIMVESIQCVLSTLA